MFLVSNWGTGKPIFNPLRHLVISVPKIHIAPSTKIIIMITRSKWHVNPGLISSVQIDYEKKNDTIMKQTCITYMYTLRQISLDLWKCYHRKHLIAFLGRWELKHLPLGRVEVVSVTAVITRQEMNELDVDTW